MKIKVKRKPGSGDDIKKLLSKLNSRLDNDLSKVFVGVPQDIPYPDGTSLIMVAAVNEFGSADGLIPERSFMRSTVEEHKPDFKKFWSKNAAKLLTGEDTPRKVLSVLGQIAEGFVKSKIVDIKTPANASSTAASKKSTNPLVDTGHLVQSIRYEVRDD